jgi:ribosomal-protein-serine acetyltransferase
MTLFIDQYLSLELLSEKHAIELYEVARADRNHLHKWLSWVENLDSPSYIRDFIKGSVARNHAGVEYAFVMVYQGKIIGRVGVYKIESYNSVGQLGYWITREFEGKGYVFKSVQRVLEFCFHALLMQRIEIRSATGNLRSQRIALRLGFTREGVLREAERIGERRVDQVVFSMLKREFNSLT